MTILQGIQPSGSLHIGNYFGAIKNQIELSEKNLTLTLIADYHALTTISNPNTLRNNIVDIVKTYLSLGLSTLGFDSNNHIVRQSSFPEIQELSGILSSVCGMNILNRSHAYRSKIENGLIPSVALYNYPILMTADILIFDQKIIPIKVVVGQDQQQHLEITEQIITSFNERYGNTFRIPQIVLSNTPYVVGTDGQKMSKSYGNTIPIIAKPEEIKKIISKIITDSKPLGSSLDFDNCKIIALLKLFKNNDELSSIRSDYENGKIGYGHAKNILSDTIIKYFSQANYYFNNISVHEVNQILNIEVERSNNLGIIAEDTIKMVREIIGLA